MENMKSCVSCVFYVFCVTNEFYLHTVAVPRKSTWPPPGVGQTVAR